MRIVRCEKCGDERWIVNELPHDWGEFGDGVFCKKCNEAATERFLKSLRREEKQR